MPRKKPGVAGSRRALRPESLGVDSRDRLLGYGAASYTYTANGELLDKKIGSQTSYQPIFPSLPA